MAQQTAVEQLINYMKENFHLTDESLKKFEQAKEMEQEQLKEMYLKGIQNYDPTFKKKSQWTKVDKKQQ